MGGAKSERQRPGEFLFVGLFAFSTGQLLDCSAWTLPVGIRKSDELKSEKRCAVCVMSNQRVSLQGGTPRGIGDGVKRDGQQDGEETPGEIEPSARLTLRFLIHHKEEKYTPPHPSKAKGNTPLWSTHKK